MKTTSKKWRKIVSIIVSAAILCTVMVAALIPSFAADEINYGTDSYTLADKDHFVSMGVDGINYTFVQTEDNQEFSFRTIYKTLINYVGNSVKYDSINFTNADAMKDLKINWINGSPFEDGNYQNIISGVAGGASKNKHNYTADVTFTSDKAASRESLVLNPEFTVNYRSMAVFAVDEGGPLNPWNNPDVKHTASFPFTVTIIDARSLADTVEFAQSKVKAEDTYTAESRDALAKAIETYKTPGATQTEINFAEALILRAVENLEPLPGVTVEPGEIAAIKADRQAAINASTGYQEFADTGHYVSMGTNGVNYTFIQKEDSQRFDFDSSFDYLVQYVENSIRFHAFSFVPVEGTLNNCTLNWIDGPSPVDDGVILGKLSAYENFSYNPFKVSFTSDKAASRDADVIKANLVVDYQYNPTHADGKFGPWEGNDTQKFAYTLTILDQRPLNDTVKEAEQKLTRTDLYTEESLALLQESVDLYRDGGITQTEINYAELLIRDAIAKLDPIDPVEPTDPTDPSEPGTTDPVEPTDPVGPTDPTDDTTPSEGNTSDGGTNVPAGDALPVALVVALAAVAGGAVIVTKKSRKDK